MVGLRCRWSPGRRVQTRPYRLLAARMLARTFLTLCRGPAWQSCALRAHCPACQVLAVGETGALPPCCSGLS